MARASPNADGKVVLAIVARPRGHASSGTAVLMTMFACFAKGEFKSPDIAIILIIFRLGYRLIRKS